MCCSCIAIITVDRWFIHHSMVSTVVRPGHVTTAHAHTHKAKSGREKRGERERETAGLPGYLHHHRAARMKHRSPSDQHQGKDSRFSPAAASASYEDTMEDRTPSNPRELTQNPLKKIWMPCKNGLPEKHISQRKGAYDNVAAVVSIPA